MAAALRVYLLLQTVSVHIGYGLHIQVMSNDDISHNLHNFVRQKREWIIPPTNVMEEVDNKNPIAVIQSDAELDKSKQITYRITGDGVTDPPYGLFVINKISGALNITRRVDRETKAIYFLTGYAEDQNGVAVESPIALRIRIQDINDNPPVFTEEVFIGAVEEMSSSNTLVMRLNATDADEENTLNSKLAFRILSQDPRLSQIFQIQRDTAEIYTKISSIDREQQSSYVFSVEVKDRNGDDETGKAGTSTVHIKVLDVNDHVPELEKEMYEGSIVENTANVEVLRIKVFDKDEEHTDNWLANFTILSGNENGYFKIETNSTTNEGVLVLVKEVDYEEFQNLELKVVASNKAAYHSSILSSGGSSSMGKVVPIKVKVKNVLEGPIFKPKTKQIYVSENKKTTVINQIIGSYQAYDEDTGKIAEHVRYAKEYDADNWFTIDINTAEIRLSKIPDRESSYVVNGTYIAKILAISEALPGKTATGTIAIHIEDINDNCPTIVNPIQTVCHDAKYISVTAKDEDAFPNGAPFTFTIVDEPVGAPKNWIIGNQNGTSIEMVPQNVWYNNHDVQILVEDMQGFSCPDKQILKLTVCTCSAGGGCMEKLRNNSASLGAGAIGLMILAFLLLLLVPLLLLLCYCGSSGKGIAAIPDSAMETLRNWNNEGAQPEDMTGFLPLVPSDYADRVGTGMKEASRFAGNGIEADSGGMYGTSHVIEKWDEHRNLLSGTGYGGGAAAEGATAIVGVAGRTVKTGGAAGATGAGGALNEEFLKDYFCDKALSYADEDEAQPAKDCLLVYCQEGVESPTGSIGCCSFVDDDLEEDLLDNLGPKFKTLAEICLGKHLITDTEISKQSSHGQHVGIPSAAGKVVSTSSVHAGDQPRSVSSENKYSVYESSIHAPELVKIPEMVTEQTVYTEESSRSGMQAARPIPDPHVHGSMLVTEKSYTGLTLKPTPVILDPLHQQNVVVTERVLAPASGFQGIMDIPDLSKGQNIVVTERLIKTDSGVPGLLVMNERPDSQYFVVTERLLAPTSGLQTKLSIPDLTDGQNVVVTERLFTPIDSLPGGMRIPSEVSGTHTVVKERNIISGAGVQGHMPNAELLINQPSIGSNRNLSQSTSKVTKYNSVQYTHS